MKIKSATYLTKTHTLVIGVEGKIPLVFPDLSERDCLSVSGIPSEEWAKTWLANMGASKIPLKIVEV